MSDQIIDEEVQETSTESQQIKANPFPGLRPFKIDESHLFFGREGQSDEVLLKLSKNRFVGVIGPSGSGKSSFIFCGVLPILYGGFLTNTSPNWEVIVTRPGASPINNMADAILEKDTNYVEAGKEDKQIKNTITNTLLRSSSLGLVEAIMQSKRKQDKNYLILVDQFEELFRFKDSENKDSINETLAFVNLLIEACNYADAPIYVAITMRSDFIGDCAQFPDLTRKINDSHYLIPQMTRDQKRKAITGPVAVGGAEITPRLIQQLLNDLGDNTDQLPILQHSLMRTWSYWANFGDIGEPVDSKHYEAIGTMKEALSMHANEAFDELDEEQKEICEVLFKAITEKRGENFGIRRPTKLSEIASILDVSEDKVVGVIDKFRAPGRSLLTPAFGIPITSNSIVDISHESLMRIWVRLKNWVNEEAEAVQMYLRLADAASMYQVGKAGLWRPPDLQLALNWQVKHKPTLIWGQRYHPAFERTMVFLEYSKKEFDTEQKIKELQRKRQLQRARVTALTMGGATVVSLLFLLYAFQQKTEADIQKEAAVVAQIEAVENADKATKAQTQAELEKEAADAAKLEAQGANEEAQIQKTAAELSAEEALLQEAEAKKQTAIAKTQENIANKKTVIADEKTIQANQSAEEARIEKEKADRLRYLAIASSMAIKSTQLGNAQKELKGLLAQQAYIFNVAHGGELYDNDIYNGLYNALKENDDPLVKDLKGHKSSVRAVETSISNNKIYTGGTKGMILRWSLQGQNHVSDILVPERDKYIIRSMAISEKRSLLLAGGKYPEVEGETFIDVIDLNNSKLKPKSVSGFEDEVWKILISKDQQGAYVLDKRGTSIKFTDFDKVSVLLTDIKSKDRIQDMVLTNDGDWLVTATASGKVIKYSIFYNMSPTTVYDNKAAITQIAISKNNKVAIGQENGTVKVFGLNDTSDLEQLVGHSALVNAIRFSSDNQFIATASNDKTVRLWNNRNLTDQPITLADFDQWTQSISFSPDNSKVLVGTARNQVKVFPTNRGDMSGLLCEKYLNRNMTEKEWATYVGDLEYEKTCKD